jgi:hypothetical protein
MHVSMKVKFNRRHDYWTTGLSVAVRGKISEHVMCGPHFISLWEPVKCARTLRRLLVTASVVPSSPILSP